MPKFKIGDKVKCINPVPSEFLNAGNYTVRDYQSKDLVQLMEIPGNAAWFDNRFELIELEEPCIKFKVMTWEEWSADILVNIADEMSCGNIDLEDIVYSPFLDFNDPKPFCAHHMFNGIYRNRVMVKHYTEKDCFWYINSDDTILIYKPDLV